ncbi:MAG: leucyl/phenylalanyl-tRNA--protein transferase [Silicimonas sp.]|nr:leucyl/phenylalanyl-tRNA--protein transferase [Silicimonas sp.]
MSDRTLSPELLLGAYASGVFPMAASRDDPKVHWVDPRRRGVLPLDGFHMSRSLARRMKSGAFHATLNTAFDDIIEGCADRDETWINETIRSLMDDLFRMGYDHAFGIWEENRLIGGMYGLALGGAFFGESMFSTQTDGSKMALAWAVDHLRRTGFALFDTQFITPHLVSLGAVEISRAAYHRRLVEALELPANIHGCPLETDPQAVVQRMTQTS